MTVDILPEAEEELLALTDAEQAAFTHAFTKLIVSGDQLGFPHSSAVKLAVGTLRELRPRGGRSGWRAFYRRVGDRIVVAAIGPEAKADRRGFARAVERAEERLAERESGA